MIKKNSLFPIETKGQLQLRKARTASASNQPSRHVLKHQPDGTIFDDNKPEALVIIGRQKKDGGKADI